MFHIFRLYSIPDETISWQRIFHILIITGFRTDSGSATPGKDYLSKETQVYFPEGNIQQVVYVHILDYDGKEDLEFFSVQLSDPEGADPSLCGITAATVNIHDVSISTGKDS